MLRRLANKFSSFFYLLPGTDTDCKEIFAFQSMRFIAFLFIFAHHCYKGIMIPWLRQSAFSVSFFIILSGFLNGNLKKNFSDFSFRNSVSYVAKKMKKLYWLHIFMLIATLPLCTIFNNPDSRHLTAFIKNAIANITLTQSWINDCYYYFGFNGVSWFLSDFLFLALMTPVFFKIISKIGQMKFGTCILCFSAALLFFLCMIWVKYVKANGLNKEFYIYVFPPSRLFEYCIGMIAGYIVGQRQGAKQNERRFSPVYTLCEILSIAFVVLSIIWTQRSQTTYFDKRLNAYIIPVVTMLAVFSRQKGLISIILSNKLTVSLGRCSMYAFLIHQILIRYMYRTVGHQRYLCLYILIFTLIISHYLYKNSQRTRLMQPGQR